MKSCRLEHEMINVENSPFRVSLWVRRAYCICLRHPTPGPTITIPPALHRDYATSNWRRAENISLPPFHQKTRQSLQSRRLVACQNLRIYHKKGLIEQLVDQHCRGDRLVAKVAAARWIMSPKIRLRENRSGNKKRGTRWTAGPRGQVPSRREN